MDEISSKRMASSQLKPCSTNVVPNTAATFATTDSSCQTNVPDNISDSTAPPSPSSAPPFKKALG